MAREWWMEINKKLSFGKAYYHTPSVTARGMHFYVQGAGHFCCEKDFFLHRREYQSLLLKYTVAGCGKLRYLDKTYELKKGSLFLIDCFADQTYETGRCENWENKWVHFYGATSMAIYQSIFDTYGPVITLPEGNGIPNHIDRLLQLFEEKDYRFEVKSSLIILELLTELQLAAIQSPPHAPADEYSQSIISACRFIDENYNRNLTVAEIAKSVNLSPFYFSRLFRRYTGFSPYEYVTKYRLNAAKHLLVTSDYTMEQIAENIGFSDSGSFIRAFKRYEEMTPYRFRKL